ncbi:MAG: TMEM175 family protein [Dehalococcoidia bacterium]
MADAAEKPQAGTNQRADVDDSADLDDDNDRVIGLSDGVFAFAMTLMVLQFDVPSPDRVAATDVAHEVLKQWPSFMAYAISFFMVANYWIVHHRIFRDIKSHDATLLWLNILCLFTISFLPFPTDVMGEYSESAFATSFYAVSMAATSLILTLIVWYASRDRRLTRKEITPRQLQYNLLRGFGVSAVFLLSIGIALVSPIGTRYFWLLLFPYQHLLNRAYRDVRID